MVNGLRSPTFAFLLFFLCFLSLRVESYSVCDIVHGYGYTCEDHLAPTPDGWSLSLQRVGPKQTAGKRSSKGVVFFQHGLTDSAAGVCLNGPQQGLPYILVDHGYDVWLGNNRGNGISMSNSKYSPSQAEFWDFSFDEMGLFDLPSNINYVLGATGAQKLSYMGHSEGTIQAFLGLISNPSLASKLNIYIALAPVAYVGNVTPLMIQALAKLDADQIVALFGVHDFQIPGAIQKLFPGICKIEPNLCLDTVDLLVGPSRYINSTKLSYYSLYEPNPTSVKNMVHWAQGVRTGKFRRFDYGEVGNRRHYNSSTPPEYPIGDFPSSLPLALFTGGYDGLADPKDVSLLVQQLSTRPMIYESDYGHLDFILGTNANSVVFAPVLDLLQKYSK